MVKKADPRKANTLGAHIRITLADLLLRAAAFVLGPYRNPDRRPPGPPTASERAAFSEVLHRIRKAPSPP